MPENTAAFNFNLYEEAVEDHMYRCQLIAADRFDPDDRPATGLAITVWSSEEDIFMR